MKPYRGVFLTAVLLLSGLSLSACGDADKWKTTTEIVLSANLSTVGFKEDVIFTVESPPPELVFGYQCETDLEYRAEGAGLDAYWHTVPGSGPTRVFVLEPRKVEPFAVIARGKCMDAKEDWKYSNQVDITVTEPPAVVPLTVSDVTVLTTPDVVKLSDASHDITINISASGPEGCVVKMRLEYVGAGIPPVTAYPNPPGQLYTVTPTAVGTLTAQATAWCEGNESGAKQDSDTTKVDP